jgi:hypothetical protein
MQNFEIGFASTKLGESFNSKSANSSRFVRAINCLASFPLPQNSSWPDQSSQLREKIRIQRSAEALVRADD